MSFETYLFDLDGTLLDSIDLIFRCYRHSASVHLETSPPDRVWRDGLGTPLRQQFGAVTSDAALIERMVTTYREYHQEHHDQSVTAYPDVRRVLESLSRRGATLGIVTSKLRPGTERGLGVTGLTEFFSVIVTADEVRRPKPDPEPVVAALDRAGATAATTVFIGDSPHDMSSGRAAGVTTAAALWGPFTVEDLTGSAPDHFLGSPDDILGLEPA